MPGEARELPSDDARGMHDMPSPERLRREKDERIRREADAAVESARQKAKAAGLIDSAGHPTGGEVRRVGPPKIVESSAADIVQPTADEFGQAVVEARVARLKDARDLDSYRAEDDAAFEAAGGYPEVADSDDTEHNGADQS